MAPSSESDLEIVHGDGTVTDKRDGVRRSYADHIAQAGPAPAPAGLAGTAAAPSTATPRRRRLYLGAAAAGAAGAGILELVTHVLGGR